MLFKIKSICKGGGYRYCRTEPPHPRRNSKGLYPLHRVKMENKLGRLLSPDEDVHHKDENKKNDHLRNLEVISHVGHAEKHAKRIPNEIIDCPCGNRFSIKARFARLQRRRNKNGLVCCSRSCGTKYAKQSMGSRSTPA